jgi:hypothetical protein
MGTRVDKFIWESSCCLISLFYILSCLMIYGVVDHDCYYVCIVDHDCYYVCIVDHDCYYVCIVDHGCYYVCIVDHGCYYVCIVFSPSS